MTLVRVLTEPQIRGMLSLDEARDAVRDAFVELHHGRVTVPNVLELTLPHNGGELDAKGAFVHGGDFFTIKIATGFPLNSQRGLPYARGLSLVFDAETGFPTLVLFDNGYLTQLRTAAAGALASDLLARQDACSVAMVGAGTQARFQLDALARVRRIDRVLVTARRSEAADEYAREMTAAHGMAIEKVGSVKEAVTRADIVITTTPAETPIVRPEWIMPGTHITAVGSDFPDKQELDVGVIERADLVVADQWYRSKSVGEIHHGIAAGVIEPDAVRTLGGIAAGDEATRRHPAEVTLADLTGVGVQDAAVATIVAERAIASGSGVLINPDGDVAPSA